MPRGALSKGMMPLLLHQIQLLVPHALHPQQVVPMQSPRSFARHGHAVGGEDMNQIFCRWQSGFHQQKMLPTPST